MEKNNLSEEAKKLLRLALITDEDGNLIKENEAKIEEHIAPIIKNFKKGDLVWAKNEGQAGLTGLVVSETPNQEVEIEVYFRGWNGDVLSMPTSELEELSGHLLDVAERKGDLLHYPNIAKKLGIVMNPMYNEMSAEQDIDENKIQTEDWAKSTSVVHDDKEAIFGNKPAKLSIDYSKLGGGGSKISVVINDKDTVGSIEVHPNGKVDVSGNNIDENSESEAPASEPVETKERPTWYQADYYDIQGGHGSLQGSSENFDAELKKALDLYMREKKAGELGKTTGYIGVSGSGDKFAILYLDQAYYNNMDPKHFKDKSAYESWMKMAKKVLETGKPQKGTYRSENSMSENSSAPSAVHGPTFDEKAHKMYLDYVNNFLTLDAFADHYGISKDEANAIIEKGRR